MEFRSCQITPELDGLDHRRRSNQGLQINFVDLLVNLRGFMTSPKNLSVTDRITVVTQINGLLVINIGFMVNLSDLMTNLEMFNHMENEINKTGVEPFQIWRG